MNSLNARVPIGGQFGDITYPVNSPMAITMGFAVHEAAVGNFADAMEALGRRPVHWRRASGVVGEGGRSTVRPSAGPTSSTRSGAPPAGRTSSSPRPRGVAHGVAAANLGLFTEAERRLTESNSSPAGEACAPAIAWYLAMTRRSQGNEEAAIALLEWLQATHPEPKVAAALKDPTYRLVTTTSEKIASRKDPWDASERRGRQLGPRETARRGAGRTRPPDRAQPGQGADRDVPRRNADGEDPRGARDEGRPARPSTSSSPARPAPARPRSPGWWPTSWPASA